MGWGTDVVAVAVTIAPGAWARGEKKQESSIKSVGFPAPKPRAVWSGLACSLAVMMWVRQNPGAPDSM